MGNSDYSDDDPDHYRKLLASFGALTFLWNVLFLQVLHETSLRIPIPQRDGREGLKSKQPFFVPFSSGTQRRTSVGNHEDVWDVVADCKNWLLLKLEEVMFMQFPFAYFTDSESQEHKLKLSLSAASLVLDTTWFQRIGLFLRVWFTATSVLALCFWCCFWFNLTIEFVLACFAHPRQGSLIGLFFTLFVLVVALWFVRKFFSAMKLQWYNTCDKYQMHIATIWRLGNFLLVFSCASATALTARTSSNIWHFLLQYSALNALWFGGLFTAANLFIGLYTAFDLQMNLASRHSHLLLRPEDAHLLTNHALWEMLLIAQRPFKQHTLTHESTRTQVLKRLSSEMGTKLMAEDITKENEKENEMSSDKNDDLDLKESEPTTGSELVLWGKRTLVVLIWLAALICLCVGKRMWQFVAIILVMYYLVLRLNASKAHALEDLYSGRYDYAYDEHLKSTNLELLTETGTEMCSRLEFMKVPQWYRRSTLKQWRRQVREDSFRECVALKLVESVADAGFGNGQPSAHGRGDDGDYVDDNGGDDYVHVDDKNEAVTVVGFEEDNGGDDGVDVISSSLKPSSVAVASDGLHKDISGSIKDKISTTDSQPETDGQIMAETMTAAVPSSIDPDNGSGDEDAVELMDAAIGSGTMQSQTEAAELRRRGKGKRAEPRAAERRQLAEARRARERRKQMRAKRREKKRECKALLKSYFENDELCVMRIPWAEHWAFARMRPMDKNDEFGVKRFCHGTCEACTCALVVLFFLMFVALASLVANDSKHTHGLKGQRGDTFEEAFYPICSYQNTVTGYNVLDNVFIAESSYYITDDKNDSIGFVSQMLEAWFGAEKTWTEHFDKSTLEIHTRKPAFYTVTLLPFLNLLNDSSGVNNNDDDDDGNEVVADLVSIRGTWVFDEIVTDFGMFTEAWILQWATWLLPLETLMPVSALRAFVWYASIPEYWLAPDARLSFDRPIVDKYQGAENDANENRSLCLVGHSLGGSIAKIAGSRLVAEEFAEVSAFAVCAPGTLFSADKFGISPGVLGQVSVNVVPKRDLVGWIDEHSGLVQPLHCYTKIGVQCHSLPLTFCELYRNCPKHLARNETFAKCVCDDENEWMDCAGLKDFEYAAFWG